VGKCDRGLDVGRSCVAAAADSAKNRAQRRMEIAEEILLRRLALAGGFIRMR
jgi:hypothetical protein